MKHPHLGVVTAAIGACLAATPAIVEAQQTSPGVLAGPLSPQPGSGSLYPTPIPRQDGRRRSGDFNRRAHGGFNGGFIFYEQPQVIREEVIIHDQPASPTPPAAPAPAREAYIIGHSYGALPGGCMKMIERGLSYFHCSGDWYQEVGSGRFKAVKAPL